MLYQINKGSSNLDDLDLNPLLVQADPGENLRYCEKKAINKVPDTLDEKIWAEINKIRLKKKNYFNYEIENTSDQSAQDYLTMCIRSMATTNSAMEL